MVLQLSQFIGTQILIITSIFTFFWLMCVVKIHVNGLLLLCSIDKWYVFLEDFIIYPANKTLPYLVL